MTTLDQLSVGQRAQINDVSGDDDISIRMMEMGLVPGTPVRVVSVAPLGDPFEIEVRGYRLSIRRSEGQRVQVSLS